MQQAIAIWQLHASRRDKNMAQTFGVDVRAIWRLLLWYQQINDVKDRHRSGHPRLTSRQNDTFIQVTVLAIISTHQLNWILLWKMKKNPCRCRVSNEAMQRRCHEHGIWETHPVVKQTLTAAHKLLSLHQHQMFEPCFLSLLPASSRGYHIILLRNVRHVALPTLLAPGLLLWKDIVNIISI